MLLGGLRGVVVGMVGERELRKGWFRWDCWVLVVRRQDGVLGGEKMLVRVEETVVNDMRCCTFVNQSKVEA